MSMPAYAVSHPELATNVLLKAPTREISRVLIPDDDKRVLLVSLLPFLNINEAMILQQVFFWQTVKNPQDPHHEYNYIYNTYEQWHQQFPYLGISTVRKYIQTLCDKGFLVKARMGDKSNTMMVKVNLSMLLRYIPADQLIPTANVTPQENAKKETLSVFPNSASVDLRLAPTEETMYVKRTLHPHHTPTGV